MISLNFMQYGVPAIVGFTMVGIIIGLATIHKE